MLGGGEKRRGAKKRVAIGVDVTCLHHSTVHEFRGRAGSQDGHNTGSTMTDDKQPLALDPSALLTEPMTLGDLAEHFGVSRRSIKGLIELIPGVTRCGRGFWRCPLQAMPPLYLVARGILLPTTIRPANEQTSANFVGAADRAPRRSTPA